jgi:hypothetical protein
MAGVPASAPIAIEVWRLGRRLAQDASAGERLHDSYRRLLAEIERVGLALDDPLGRPYVAGMAAEIVDMPDGAALEPDSLVVSDVLRPAVFFAGRCVVQPQIILSRKPMTEAPK